MNTRTIAPAAAGLALALSLAAACGKGGPPPADAQETTGEVSVVPAVHPGGPERGTLTPTTIVGPARPARATVDRAISVGSPPTRTIIVTFVAVASSSSGSATRRTSPSRRRRPSSAANSDAQLHTNATAMPAAGTRWFPGATTTVTTATPSVTSAASASAMGPRRSLTFDGRSDPVRPVPDAGGTWRPGRWSQPSAARA